MAKKTCNFKYNPSIKDLCNPSMLYFVLSIIVLIVIGIQNLKGDDHLLCLGQYKCTVGSKTVVFLLHAIYMLFWTFVLDLICKAGYSELSWFIVLIPFLIAFILMGILIYQS